MDILNAWLDDLPQQFQGKEFIEGLIWAFAKQLKEIQGVFKELDLQTDLESAVGRNLDMVGDIVALTRKEAGVLAGIDVEEPVISDERYRRFLKYQILVNTNDCTYYDLMNGLDFLWENHLPFYYKERPEHPATIFMEMPQTSLDDEDPLKGRTPAIRPAGVGLKYVAFYKGVYDNRNLETVELKKVLFKLGFSFWGRRVFDGTWILDGNRLFDAGRKILGAKLKLGMQTQWDMEKIEGLTVTTKTSDCWFLDGSLNMDGKKNFNSIYRKEVME